MGNEIALREVNVDDSVKLQKVSQGLFQSGIFPNLKSTYGAYAVVQYGYELGLGPMTSLQNINLIQGKPAANGQTMLSLAMSRGVTFSVLEETAEKCSIKFKRGDMEYTSTFTLEDAKRAGLTGKDNWKKWPVEMLYWRAVAKGVRRIAPEAVMGLYTPEELTHGETIEVKAEPTNEPARKEPKEQMATKAQLTKINALLNQQSFSREEKLDLVNNWLEDRGELGVKSSKELTKQQASELIDAIENGMEPEQPGGVAEGEVENATVNE